MVLLSILKFKVIILNMVITIAVPIKLLFGLLIRLLKNYANNQLTEIAVKPYRF